MATFAVYHLIYVRTPHQHIPKLVITDAPEGEQPTEELLERAVGLQWPRSGWGFFCRRNQGQ